MMNAPTTPRLPEHRKRVVVVSSEKFRPPNVALTRRMQQQQQQQQPVSTTAFLNYARDVNLSFSPLEELYFESQSVYDTTQKYLGWTY